MKFKYLLSETVSFFAIAWLFWLAFYFHYIQQSHWYGEFAEEYQQLSLVFAYFMAFYIVVALLVLSTLNIKVVSHFRVINKLLAYWPYFSFGLKVLVFPLTIYGLYVVSIGH